MGQCLSTHRVEAASSPTLREPPSLPPAPSGRLAKVKVLLLHYRSRWKGAKQHEPTGCSTSAVLDSDVVQQPPPATAPTLPLQTNAAVAEDEATGHDYGATPPALPAIEPYNVEERRSAPAAASAHVNDLQDSTLNPATARTVTEPHSLGEDVETPRSEHSHNVWEEPAPRRQREQTSGAPSFRAMADSGAPGPDPSLIGSSTFGTELQNSEGEDEEVADEPPSIRFNIAAEDLFPPAEDDPREQQPPLVSSARLLGNSHRMETNSALHEFSSRRSMERDFPSSRLGEPPEPSPNRKSNPILDQLAKNGGIPKSASLEDVAESEEGGEGEEQWRQQSIFGTGLSHSRSREGEESNNTIPPMKPSTAIERHNVTVVGDGPELLFLSHGFGTNQQIWGGVLDGLDLVNTYRVILWDLMGAYSTSPEGFDFQRYSTLHGYADDMLELLDELEVEEVTYVGHSVSGMLGVIACTERPALFKRLILIGASPRYLDAPDYEGGFSLEMLDQVFAAMQDNYKVWASGFAPLVVGEDVESDSVREFCRSLFLIRPDIAFSTLKTIFMCDMRHILPQVTVQVHLLQTAKDNAVPWKPVQYMLDTFPNSCVEMLPVEGHLPHLTHPGIVTEAILRHLDMPIRSMSTAGASQRRASSRVTGGVKL